MGGGLVGGAGSERCGVVRCGPSARVGSSDTRGRSRCPALCQQEEDEEWPSAVPLLRSRETPQDTSTLFAPAAGPSATATAIPPSLSSPAPHRLPLKSRTSILVALRRLTGRAPTIPMLARFLRQSRGAGSGEASNSRQLMLETTAANKPAGNGTRGLRSALIHCPGQAGGYMVVLGAGGSRLCTKHATGSALPETHSSMTLPFSHFTCFHCTSPPQGLPAGRGQTCVGKPWQDHSAAFCHHAYQGYPACCSSWRHLNGTYRTRLEPAWSTERLQPECRGEPHPPPPPCKWAGQAGPVAVCTTATY